MGEDERIERQRLQQNIDLAKSKFERAQEAVIVAVDDLRIACEESSVFSYESLA